MSSFPHTFQGTIKPKANFNADIVAEELENAMKGKGCDKMKIIQLIIHINNAQRQMVLTPYQRKFDKELIPELKKELSGDFEDVIIGLMATPTLYDAIQMMDAMKVLLSGPINGLCFVFECH
ncbi:unnamed protein product [Anisakis simplex]|uniref:Annexin n=1 Tax=Anisakis simplex TaxID=6269 RepID=A0A0M3J414_ANISI|nr:unnamed protein product [Anisakis simplex]